MTHKVIIFPTLCVVVLALFLLNIFYGAVRIPVSEVLGILSGNEASNVSWQYIVMGYRLSQALTALLTGSVLSVCGLMLQVIFRNPLADSSILGIGSGAGLGVACVMLMFGGGLYIGTLSVAGFAAVFAAALSGALAVTFVMLFLSSLIRNNALLLIAGVMLGYITSSVVMLLNFFASADGVRAYVQWGMGNFSGVSEAMLPFYAILSIVCIAASSLLVKPLNIMMIGSRYAENLGVNIKRLRTIILLLTGVMAALSTAFCGPIAFIGLAVPHLSRLLLRTDDFRLIMPTTILLGAIVALICNFICVLPSNGCVLPLNAVTPFLGVPIILYVISRKSYSL